MYLLFDIGGTQTRIAYSKDGEGFEEPIVYPTPHDFEEGISKLIEYGKNLTNGNSLKAVVGGIAGPLNLKKSKTVYANTTLQNWVQKPLKKELFKSFGVPVFIENDAALGGLGEAHFGSGKTAEILAYITIGTGVGGARIVSGQIDYNNYGFEPGHLISSNGEKLENIISGTAISTKYNKKPQQISDSQVWETVEQELAIGLNNVAVLWSPQVIILGGGLIRNQLIDIFSVETKYKNLLDVFPNPPKIKQESLGNTSGLFGALIYGEQCLKS